MRALTLWQPWAWAVAAGHKTIENRPWPPPMNLHRGERIAIHAGKRWDQRGADAIERVLGDIMPAVEQVFGAVIAIAEVAACVRDDFDLTADQRPWFFGPFGWVLRDVRALEQPVPVRGFQRLWRLPHAVTMEIERQLARSAT